VVTVLIWFVVCGYAPTSIGAVLAIAAMRTEHDYGYRGRHHAPGRRRTAPSTFALSVQPIDTPELRVARVRVEQVAERIEHRARLWSDDRSPRELAEAYLGIDGIEHVRELARHEPAAGSEAYLAVTPGALAQPGAVNRPLARETLRDRIDTKEMVLRFGAELGPVLGPPVDDEWVMPDEDGPDPGTGRHARGRATVSA